MKNWMFAGMIAVFAFSLTACTQKQEAGTGESPPPAVTSAPPSPAPAPMDEAKEGKPMQPPPATASIPADFPVSMIEGAEITKVQIGGTAQQVELTVAKGWQEVAAFYETQLKQKGFSVRKRDENTGESDQSLILADKPEGVLGASISQKRGESRSEVILNWMKRD